MLPDKVIPIPIYENYGNPSIYNLVNNKITDEGANYISELLKSNNINFELNIDNPDIYVPIP